MRMSTGVRIFVAIICAMWLAVIGAAIWLVPSESEEGGDPPNLVTEEYLRRAVAIDTAAQVAYVMGDIALGPLHRFNSRIVATDADHYDTDSTVTVTYVANDGSGLQRHARVTVKFDQPDYEAGVGSVTTSNCRTQPGSGDVTSGKFKTFDDTVGTGDLTVDYEASVTLENSRETSLTENLELSNSTTVEAGVDFGAGSGSVSDTLSETFGISQTETDDTSTSKTETVHVSTVAQTGSKLVVVITEDNEALVCDVAINGVVDWGKITATVQSPAELPESWGDICADGPELYENVCYKHLADTDAFSTSGRDLTTSFEGVIDVLRLASGETVKLPPGTTFDLSDQAKTAVDWLETDTNRWLTLKAQRRSDSQANAGYRFVDATGVSEDCVSDTYGSPGKSPSAVALEACR